MYLNHTKIWLQRGIYGFMGIVLSGYSFLMCLGCIFQITGYSSSGLENMAFIYYTTFLFLFADFLCIRAIMRTFRAAKMSRYFEKDKDGLVDMEVAAKEMKMKHSKFVEAFMDYVGRGLLVKCGICAEDPTYILLENGQKDIRQRFAVLHCSNCAGPNAVRIGFKHNCKYCGTEIKSR